MEKNNWKLIMIGTIGMLAILLFFTLLIRNTFTIINVLMMNVKIPRIYISELVMIISVAVYVLCRYLWVISYPFGDKLILLKSIPVYDPISGEKTVVPKGTVGVNCGIPAPYTKYNGKRYIELELIHPIQKDRDIVKRIILKRDTSLLRTYFEDEK